MKSEDCRWSVGNTGTLEGFISPNGKLIAGYPSTHIDVRMFGETGSSDDASVIQQAIDYATTLTWGGVVTIPINTTLNVSNVILKNKVGIESSSRSGRKARLQSVGADSGGMITLATGGLIDCSVRNLSLRGDATHTSKWLLDLACDKTGGSDGQFTDGIFENLLLTNNVKNISIRGTVSGTGALEPFQWTTFRKVRVEAKDSATTEPLKIIGQTGQTTFEQCGFGSDTASSPLTPIAVNLYNNGSVNPLDVGFIRCWLGNAVLGAQVTNCQDIRFGHTYCENLTNGINFQTSSTGSIDGLAMVQGSGYGVRSSSSRVTVGNSRFASTLSNALFSENGGVIVPFGVNNTVDVSPTSGMVQDIGVTGSGTTGAVSTSSHEILRVTTSAVEIKTITGFHITTKTVTLIANGGSIIFNTSGNINLGGRASPFTLTSDKSATFMVTDIAGVKAYRLITVSS